MASNGLITAENAVAAIKRGDGVIAIVMCTQFEIYRSEATPQESVRYQGG